MVAKTPALEIADVSNNPCCLPVHNLSSQTRHITGNQNAELKRSRRMLSVFALVLGLALATVLCLLIAASPVNAMQLAHQPHVDTADDIVALAALLSLSASASVGIVLVKSQLSPARKR